MDNKTEILNEYDAFDLELKKMIDSGKITSDMAENIKRFKKLRKNLGTNRLLIQQILDTTKNGSIL